MMAEPTDGFCSQCGTARPSGAAFCAKCGAAFSAASVPAVEMVIATQVTRDRGTYCSVCGSGVRREAPTCNCCGVVFGAPVPPTPVGAPPVPAAATSALTAPTIAPVAQRINRDRGTFCSVCGGGVRREAPTCKHCGVVFGAPVPPTPVGAAPVPAAATPALTAPTTAPVAQCVNRDRGTFCSVCNGGVRVDARTCKHCGAVFDPALAIPAKQPRGQLVRYGVAAIVSLLLCCALGSAVNRQNQRQTGAVLATLNAAAPAVRTSAPAATTRAATNTNTPAPTDVPLPTEVPPIAEAAIARRDLDVSRDVVEQTFVALGATFNQDTVPLADGTPRLVGRLGPSIVIELYGSPDALYKATVIGLTNREMSQNKNELVRIATTMLVLPKQTLADWDGSTDWMIAQIDAATTARQRGQDYSETKMFSDGSVIRFEASDASYLLGPGGISYLVTVERN